MEIRLPSGVVLLAGNRRRSLRFGAHIRAWLLSCQQIAFYWPGYLFYTSFPSCHLFLRLIFFVAVDPGSSSTV